VGGRRDDVGIRADTLFFVPRLAFLAAEDGPFDHLQ